jgi:hypothetical protein
LLIGGAQPFATQAALRERWNGYIEFVLSANSPEGQF